MGLCIIPITRPLPGSTTNDGKKPFLQQWMPYMTRRSVKDEWNNWWPVTVGTPLNIGVVTGRVSDIAVLDFDDEESYRQVIRLSPAMEETFTVKTGKGYHVYFHPDIHTRTTTFKMNGKLHHCKQEGGYVVAPPSKHKTGRLYEIYNPNPPAKFKVENIVSLLKEAGAEADVKTYRERAANWASELMQITPDGERNTRAAQLCGLLIRKFPFDPGLVEGLMIGWNNTYCKPPMDDEEINKLITNEIRRYGPRD